MQLVSTTTKLRLKFYAQVQCQSFHTASTHFGHRPLGHVPKIALRSGWSMEGATSNEAT
jgi:hypothetical protein